MTQNMGNNRKWLWSQRTDYARLQREVRTFRIDLDFLVARTQESSEAWIKAAHSEIESVEGYLSSKDNIEGGWLSLHAARRYSVYGLSAEERYLQASILRAEASKIESWRGKEMERLLAVNEDELTAQRLTTVMALRDEFFSNQYHKLWLVGGQISILLYTCGLGLFLLLPIVVSSSRRPEGHLTSWGYEMVTSVIFFGLLGAAFSAAGSLMRTDPAAKIPERVANQFVTIARALLGSGVGLAGYAFYLSKILDFHFCTDCGPGGALTIAFLFGFSGERLITQVLGTLGSRNAEAQK